MAEILHLSDLHFGPNFLADRAAAAAALEARLGPDLVVVSGDLTRRAKRDQFGAARAYLDGFSSPLVVTPGNHDVPLFRAWERFLAPRRNFLEAIPGELDRLHRFGDLAIVTLDSTRRLTFTDGRLRSRQLAFARQAFDGDDAAIRIVVTHHPLTAPADFEGGRPMPGAGRALRTFAELGVRLVLAGHMHRTYMSGAHAWHPEIDRDRDVLIVHSGTASCSRGRGPERGENSLQYIRIDAERIRVTTYRWRAGDFRPVADRRFGPVIGADLAPHRVETIPAGETEPVLAVGERRAER